MSEPVVRLNTAAEMEAAVAQYDEMWAAEQGLECTGANCWERGACPKHDAEYAQFVYREQYAAALLDEYEVVEAEEGWDRLPEREREMLLGQWMERKLR